jgi:hypothetical protein
MTAILLAEGCGGPGPLTPGEVRLLWRHGALREVVAVDGGVRIVVECPPEHGPGLSATLTLLTREVREFERRDPLMRRDPLQLVAWRRCSDEAERRRRP